MTKRILSLVLVLAMLVSVLPVSGVYAEGAQTAHNHSDAHACSAQCTAGTITWIAWNKADSLPADSGHYYLMTDVQLTNTQDTAAGKDITICLNGYNIRSASDKRIGYVYGKLTIADCTAYEQEGQYISGSVVGSTAADGAVLSVRRGGTLVLDGGKITGGIAKGSNNKAGGGGVYLQKGDSTGAGGVFYMYSGEISGNEGYSGGGVCLDGADSGCIAPAFYMYGGTITDNHARNSGGGVYAVTRATVQITNGTITGNTTDGKATSVHMEGGLSKLTVSGAVKLDGLYFAHKDNAGLRVNGLTNGTEIVMTTTVADGAEADIAKTVSVASGGAQSSWNAHWITANGESVSMLDGAFTFGHYHGTTKYNAWTGTDSHNTLPNGNKSYYLANDIIRNTNGGAITIETDVTQHLCLNGHTITHRNPSGRLHTIKGNFILEDCSAYTDAEGNYISGGITYAGATASSCNNGMYAYVSRGGTMTMTGGQIYGFESSLASSQNGTLIYVQGASPEAKAVFNLQGGQIHSNKSANNGSVLLAMKADPAATTMDTYTQINISGGKIWGNTSTSGGVVAAVSNHINITGGTITGNTVKKGAVYGRNENNISVSGNPTIYGNNGGNLYISGERMLTVGTMTGGKIGLSVEISNRYITNALAADPTAYFVSDDSALPIIYEDNCLYLGAGHTHGIDGETGDMRWKKWTATDSLPTDAGNYYLAEDVQLTAAVTLAADVNLCLNGKTVTAASGKRILTVSTGATLTITDCCDNCGTLTGGNSSYGGAIQVQRGAVLNLYNGIFTNNVSTDANNGVGGAIYLQAANASVAGGVFNMYGGKITGNTAAKGGAIGTGDGMETTQALTRINIYGGEITNNEATNNGGAIRTGTYAQVTISNVEITGNTSDANGGAVYMGANGSLNIENSSITGNTAKNGGGVYVHKDITSFRVSGNVQITNNQKRNIYLPGDVKITVDHLTEGAKLFVAAEKIERAVTGDLTEAEAAYFYCDDAYRMINYRNGVVRLEVSDEHTHCECFQGCDHSSVKWQAWESDSTLPVTSGHYYLLNDVQLTDVQSVGENVHICLNGKTVTAAEGKRIATVTNGATLSVMDCAGNSGKLTGGNSNSGGAINVTRGATFNLYSGVITGNASTDADNGVGGAIYLQAANATVAGGVFNMYGGVLTGNTAAKGGAIGTGDGVETTLALVQINIYGGEISNNESTNNGGAIRTGTYGQVNITGGVLTGNTSGANGGAIYIGTKGSLNIANGLLTGNTTKNYGGAVYSTSEVTISNSEMSGNGSGKDGGAVYCSGATAVIIESKFTGNVTKTAGGATGFTSGCKAEVQNCTYENNQAANGGAVIVQGGADLTIKESTFTGNETTMSGGSIYVSYPTKDGDRSELLLDACKLEGNKAASAGGAVYLAQADAVIKDTVLTNNEAAKNAGAVYAAKNGTLNIQNSTISKNIAANYGGAIYSLAETIVSGSELSGNNSGKDGGALYCGGVSATISDSKFIGNQVAKGAGGAVGFSMGCQAVIESGVFTENTAANGGAVIVQGGADLTIKGGDFTKNVATIYAGAIYVSVPNSDTGDVSVLTLEGGTIAENKSAKNGGAVYVNQAEFIMTGGTVSKNESPSYGGGIYVGKTISKVTGGTITGNVSTKDGAGIYFYGGQAEIGGAVKITGNSSRNGAGGGLGFTRECKATLSGGTITGNDAGNAGGIIVQGQAHLTMTGGYVGQNTTRAAGGGVYVNKSSMDFLGGTIEGNTAVKTGAGLMANDSTTRFAGTVFNGNKAAANGGAVYIAKGKATFTGGRFTNNSSERYGGAIYTNTAEVTMENILISGNAAELGSGGIHGYLGKLTLTNVEVKENSTSNSCGGVYATQFCQLTMNDCLVEKNVALRGGGVMVNARASATLTNVIVRENEATEGGGVYVNSNVENFVINGGEVSGNVAKKRVSTTGKMIAGAGAGLYVNTATKTSSGHSRLYVNNAVIRENKAEGIGGGAYVNMQMHLYLDTCTVENNTAGDMGAGIYQASGSYLYVKNTDIIGNVGAGNGSAIYAGSDFELDGGKITGNKTTDGTAVYVAPANYDGQSYANATVKIGGDLVIFDNEGTMAGDLYFDEGVAAAGTVSGFGENTKIKIQLHSGLLTDSLLAAYNYEGGDGVYTITYGTRSLTEPEYVAPETSAPEGSESGAETEAGEDTTVLFVGIGGIAAVVIIAAIVMVLTKKKKSATAEKE